MDSRVGIPRGVLPSGILKMKKILSGPGCSQLLSRSHHWQFSVWNFKYYCSKIPVVPELKIRWQRCLWHPYVGDFMMVTDFLDVLNRSKTSQTCHKHIWFPTSVTNIDLTENNCNKINLYSGKLLNWIQCFETKVWSQSEWALIKYDSNLSSRFIGISSSINDGFRDPFIFDLNWVQSISG